MSSLSFADIFDNAMHFNTRDGLLYKSVIRFSKLFQFHNISYYIVGGYALIFHGVIRNTMDIDIIIAETDFQKAKQVSVDFHMFKYICMNM